MTEETRANRAAYNRKWRRENKDRLAAYHKEYNVSNRDNKAQANKNWRKANPDKVAEHNKRHLLKLSLANSKISGRALAAWAEQVKERTPFCEWCYSEDNLEAHHIMPKAKYPQHALDINNGRTMCQNCHMNCHMQGGY
jgi:5-methylcytosine-specific restriction endonuclease McrA